MLGPNQHTMHMANQSYEERLSHSARIRMVQNDRQDDQPFVLSTHRTLTVRRLAAAGVAGFVLTAALAAAGASAVAASPSHAGGGGVVLIR
jgi:hypothetical protein